MTARPCAYTAAHRMAEGEGIEPPGAVPRRRSKTRAKPNGSLPVIRFSIAPSARSERSERRAEGEGFEPPCPRTGPPLSKRLGVPMPNPPAEGEGIEPPLTSRPDLRVPSECHYHSANLPLRRERGSNPRWSTRPRRSKPVPFHSAIPPGAWPRRQGACRCATASEFIAAVPPGSATVGVRAGYRDDEDRLPSTYAYDDETEYVEAYRDWRARRVCWTGAIVISTSKDLTTNASLVNEQRRENLRTIDDAHFDANIGVRASGSASSIVGDELSGERSDGRSCCDGRSALR